MISVIIPAFNAADSITACLAALLPQCRAHGAELIVVDDGSTDETAVIAAGFGVQVLHAAGNRGAAAARNLGIQAASGDIICFTDADCTPHPTWLQEIVAPLANAEIVAAKGIYATRQTQLVARFVQIEYEDKYDLLRRHDYIDFIDTYAAAYRRQALLATGGFDERIAYVEDQELGFRLAARGHKMVFQPTAVVDHLHSSRLWPYMRKKFMIGFWKAQIMRRFPERAIKDSHTPQVLKLQMLLVAGSLTAVIPLALLSFWTAARRLLLLPLGSLLLFLASTLPFTIKAWRKERQVGVAAPFLLATRALALGFGYAWGLLRPNFHYRADERNISLIQLLMKRLADRLSNLSPRGQ